MMQSSARAVDAPEDFGPMSAFPCMTGKEGPEDKYPNGKSKNWGLRQPPSFDQ